ncbi:MAG: hypothetical protein GX660_00405 [Clostridiaceae bacterium]|nr:hypothetical protein [Clostridiaceae bacterium]
MNEKEAFDKINDLLDITDYPITIRSTGDIEDFLLDDSNRRFTEQYAAIGRIYDDLRGRPEIDRYPEPSVGKVEETHNTAFNADNAPNRIAPNE